MPFLRPTLSDLRNQVAQDIASALPGSDPLLRFSSLQITGVAQAGLAHEHYGYLDWIARQSVPFTATDEFLEGWAGLIGITRIPAASASGAVAFNGAIGKAIPVGTSLVRGDGTTMTVTTGGTLGSSGPVTVLATVDADPSGATGAFGNCAVGVPVTLSQPIPGIQSTGFVTTAFVGGADLEKDDALKTRMLYAYQNQPQGGASADYVRWALQVPGVTRAWTQPNGFGVGTVVVYVMLDVVRAAGNGFPIGTNGVAATETRGTAATGDQLLAANHILPLQPVTALAYVTAPIANPIAFTIQGIPGSSRSGIAGAINGVFQVDGAPGKTIPLAHVWSAIAAVSGVNDFVITTPTADITNSTGQLPTVGAITYT